MADAVLAIKIVTDYAQGAAGLNTASSRAQKFGAGLQKLALPAGVALGAVVAFGKGAVEAASRTEQAMGGVDAVFGKNAEVIKAWSDTAADRLGLSAAAYGELATKIGSQLKNAGLSLDQTTKRTGGLIDKGADLAAMFGGTTAEAVEALSSALKGEFDPMDNYGGSLSAAKIAAEQAAMGTDKLTGKAADQAKVMATLNLITKQTSDSVGAAAREHDSAAASSQRLAAQYEDLQSDLGTALLPAMVKFAAALSTVVKWMSKHQTATTIIIASIAALAAAILALNVAMTVYTAVTTLAASATVVAWATALWPILAVIAAVLLVVGAVVLLWKKSATFRKVVLAVWSAIKGAATTVARAVSSAWSATINKLKSLWKGLSAAVKAVWSAIRSAASSVANTVADLWRNAVSKIKTVLTALKGAAKAVWDAIKSAVQGVIDRAQSLIAKLRGIQVPGAIKAAIDAIKGAIDNVIDAVQSLIGWLKDLPVPHIDWPDPPSWLPGVKSAPAPAVGPSVATMGGVGAPRVPTRRASSTVATGPTIVIQGALDPEAVARQVRRLLGGHDRRIGAVTA